MRFKLRRHKSVVAGVAALAVGLSLLPIASPAQALPPGTPAAGSISISPATGNSGTTFSLGFATQQFCPGDATTDYRWHTFITPLGNDPADFIYSASGTPTGEPAFTNNLADAVGTRVRAQNPGLGDGLVVAPTGLSFASSLFATLSPGAYTVGIACTRPDAATLVQTEKFWTTAITVATSTGAGPNNFTYSVGVAPTAATLTTATAGNGQCTVAFTGGTGATSHTVTANPGAIAQGGAGSPITVGGLTNGTTYTLSIASTNTSGTTAGANTLTCTPAEAARPPVQNLQATPGTGQVTVTFAAPTGVAPNDYTLVVTPGPVAGSPFTITGAGPYSQVVSGLAPGTPYTFTVTPNHTAPATGTPASVVATPNAAQVLNQEITVERPTGALILTQRCGVNNALDAFAAVDAFPGFPKALVAEGATSNQIGTAPIDDDNAPTLDGEFPEYPQPSNPTYPTTCGVTLGVGQLVTTGALAGQYYTAEGFLNEITVLDTRPTNDGWTITGNLDDQFATTGDTFDGNYLGWDPQVGSTTPGQTVAAGPIVLPGTGVGADPALGLADGRTLASAAAGAGNGIAQLDARLLLLIPVAADAGVYNATLTFTAV